MLMNRTLARMRAEPAHDTIEMEAAKALQSSHLDADLEFLEADSALGVIDAVLLCGRVPEDACAARRAAQDEADSVAHAGYGNRLGDLDNGVERGGGERGEGRGGLGIGGDGRTGAGAADCGLDAFVDVTFSQRFEFGLIF